MKLRAMRTFRYAGKRLAPDDEFETRSELDGRLLIAVKHAETVEPKAKKQKRVAAPNETSLDALRHEVTQMQEQSIEHRRTYNRRDLEAESE